MSIVGAITYDGLKQPVYWASAFAAPIKLKTVVPDFPDVVFQEGAAFGINNSGNIVGTLRFSRFNQAAVYWADYSAPPTLLKSSDGTVGISGSAQGINNLGEIVGLKNFNEPVYWTDSSAELKLLKKYPIRLSMPLGINDLGEIVGGLTGETDEPLPAIYWKNYSDEPILLNLGEFKGGAFSINNSGEIIGGYGGDFAVIDQPTVYWENSADEAKLLNLSGGGFACGFNNSRAFVGYIVNDDPNFPVPMYWLNSTAAPIALQFTGGSSGRAYGISDQGPGPSPPTPTPSPSPTPTPLISNICFPAGTEITTDQGVIAI